MVGVRSQVAVLVLAFAWCQGSVAQGTTSKPSPTDELKALQELSDVKKAVEDIRAKQAQEIKDTFLGVQFGAGLSVAGFGKNYRKRVTDAQIVNGIVRATEESTSVARIMLETHYMFPVKDARDSTKCSGFLFFRCPDGHGPFIAVQPGTTEVIEAIGIGWMFGYLREENSKDSFNLGVGVLTEPRVKVLGDGFVPNEPPPAGETEVRYKYDSRYAIFLMASFVF